MESYSGYILLLSICSIDISNSFYHRCLSYIIVVSAESNQIDYTKNRVHELYCYVVQNAYLHNKLKQHI